MAKLSLTLLALMAALLLVADASIVRTTITTTEIEEDNPHGHHGGGSSTFQQCPRQQLQGKRINSCRNYLTKSSGSPYDILRVADVNPFSQERQGLRECCNELQEIQQDLQNPQCACEALKQIINDEREQGSRFQGRQGQREIGQMLQKAKNIPEQCENVRSCRFQEY